jgi:lysophospholipase L1-like esterase
MKQCALIAAIIVAEFAILEAGLRMFGQSEAGAAFQSLFITEGPVGYRLRPGATIRYWTSEFDTPLAINAQGVRDDDAIGPKAEGERRVLILGDSYVFAVQVPFRDTMGERLEARLNESSPGTQWRVINGGVQGYGPVEEWLFYRHVAAQFDPDIVLILVSSANDAIEAYDARATLAAGGIAEGSDSARPRSPMRDIVRSSMVLQVVRQRADQLRARVSNAVAERPMAIYLEDPPAFVAEGIATATRAFGRIADEAREHGAAVAFVLMPARMETNDADFERASTEAAALGGVLKRHAATERFSRALKPLGYPMLDLLPVFASAHDIPTLHFVRNSHLTARGHQVTADAMLRFLVASGLVPGRRG